MKNILLNILLIGLLAMHFACEVETKWDIQPDGVDRLVVDGIVTNEYRNHCIKLSVTNQELNADPRPLSGAIVIVTDSVETINFAESPTEPGSYYSAPFQAVIDKEYQLHIEYMGVVFEASAQGLSVTPLESPAFRWDDDNILLRYLYSESNTPSMLDLYYNWENVQEYCSEYGRCFAMETFYTLDNIDVSNIYAPEKQIIWFPEGTAIIRKKYSLSAEHQRFLRSLLMETEWRGGVFDVQQGNVPTNISNGALGYFAVCMTVSDTIYVH